ncbi:MAG: FAD-dependent oxidoreductase [Deltaproteobacteria bacterium]|nr:FAD-dependent oxidoreductase [Deltaproteobacteria bacterium]
MKKHLIIVGGGHAHLTVLKKAGDFVERGHRVTLISSAPYHYYSGMGPGMLSGIYRPEEIRFHIKKMAEDRGVSFVEGNVVRVDPDRRILFLDSNDEIGYDIVSFNTGSEIPLESVTGRDEKMITVKPIENLHKARRAVMDLIQTATPRLVVVGGGAAGLEISGNIWRLVHDLGGKAQIKLLAGRRLLGRFPEKTRRLAMESLSARGIEVAEGAHLRRFESGQAVMTDGRKLYYDLLILALGVKPSSLFRDSGLPTGDDRGLLVNTHLQSVAYPEIFGGGDCISLESKPLNKVGVYAVRQNPVLYHNLMAALEGGNMEPFDPDRPYLLIFSLGDGRGIFWKKNWVWNGRLSFYLKDYIDRKFMRRFQVSGERMQQGTS